MRLNVDHLKGTIGFLHGLSTVIVPQSFSIQF